jgi:hypothetical protein
MDMKLVLGRMKTNALLLALLAAPIASNAQSVTLFGSLYNFDVLNDTGQDTHGFEIELDGITSSQVLYTFPATRYGDATITPFNGGVYVRWQSTWDAVAQQFVTATTVPASFTPTFGHACVLTNIIGCDHYGVTLQYYTASTAVAYRWLVADPANPGALIPFAGPKVQIPQPTVTVAPPQAGLPAQVAFQIEVKAPPPPEIPKPELQFGEAKWVKVFKTELQREVNLNELVDDNPIVPQDPGLLETAWKLLQFNPHSANSGVLKNQGGVNSGSRSVLRRYEFYKFGGTYDPASHQAICGGDGLCTAPIGTEMGDFIGSQNAAANIGVPSITVTKTGSGTVNGAGGKINCGGSCTTTLAAGTAVTLTANPGGTVFSGWGGDCNGTQTTCSLTVNAAQNVTATFTSIFTLSIGRGGNGTVTGTPTGVLSTQISCGGNCSAKFTDGTIVTLNATPGAGLKFVNWTGACQGTVPSCDVAITKNTQVQANFK